MVDFNEFNGKKVMITGGLGFIGSNLAHELIKYGADVLIVDSLLPEYGGNLFNVEDIKDKVKINFADIRSEHSMYRLVEGKDYLFNLAGQLSHIDSMTDPYSDLDINCRAQLSLLEACRKFNPKIKVVFAGTRSQYGKVDYLPVDEKHPMRPTDVNGINNIAGEWYHILYNNVYGIRACSLRMTNTYGPRHQMKHSKQGFLSWFVRLAIDNEPIKIYGDGKQLRDFNYVTDVVNALMTVMLDERANGEIFNLGSGKPVSVADSAKLIVEAAKNGSVECIPWPDDKKKIEVGDYYASFDKIKNLIGWEPKVSFEEGLKETVEFYKKNKDKYW